MAKYSNTKAKINEKITTNGAQAVTGIILNDVLQTMVDSLGADYQFGGLVQPGSSFTAGEQPVVFLATTPGTYTNFGGLVVADGEVALLVWSGSAWSKQTTDIATRTEVSQLGQYVENPEWVKVVTDSEDKILYGVKTDGNFYFGNGCPPQVQEYVQAQIDAVGIDALLATKVDKVVGKSLIDADFAAAQSVVENNEFLEVKTDSEDKILYGVKTDGNFYFGKGCPQQIASELNKKVDKEEGKGLIDAAVSTCLSVNENLEYTEATVDKDSKVVESRNINTGIKEERIGYQSPVVITDKLILTRKGIDNFSKTLQILGVGVKGTEEYSESLTKALNMPVAHPTNASGKELYSDINTYDVERKACRCRYVRWTALSPIPKDIIGEDAYFNAGDMIGIPYTSAMEWDKMVGYDLSYTTFMTAANNPYSLLYTENPRNNGSVYGFNYFQPARGTVAGWAGIVCNILCNYSTGMSIPYDTGMFKYLASIGKFVKVCPQNAQGVRIGDILWQEGHARLVQNVWRDSNGLVQKIEVSKGGWTDPEYMFNSPEDFDEDLAGRNGIIYRNAELFKNYEYSNLPFPIVPVVGEDYPADAYSYQPSTPYQYNDDICTYAGDYACFREGYRIVLNYNLKNTNNNWQSVELYKDNMLYGTYLLSSDAGTYDRGPANYPAETAALVPSHSFDLSFLNLTYGKYKARLTDGNGNYSDYTYFEIIDTEISYTIKHGVITIDFSTHNSIPHYVRISYPSGAPKCLYELTKEDIENGRCSFNFVELIEKQYNNLGIQGEILKVYFKGDYGTVTSSPINITPYIHW
jgi:hypothetical protein